MNKSTTTISVTMTPEQSFIIEGVNGEFSLNAIVKSVGHKLRPGGEPIVRTPMGTYCFDDQAAAAIIEEKGRRIEHYNAMAERYGRVSSHDIHTTSYVEAKRRPIYVPGK